MMIPLARPKRVVVALLTSVRAIPIHTSYSLGISRIPLDRIAYL